MSYIIVLSVFDQMKKFLLTLLLLGFGLSLYAQSAPEPPESKNQKPAERTEAQVNEAVKVVPTAKGMGMPQRVGPARKAGSARAPGDRHIGGAKGTRATRPAARPVAPGRGR